MNDPATTKDGSRAEFPTTRWTTVLAAGDPAAATYRASLEELARLYWRPIYAYFRRKWNKPHDEARDLSQDFFAALCEKDFLSRLSPERGRFRSYVMAALDNFARLEHRARTALKRGGGATVASLDRVEEFHPSADRSPEETFLREWGRSVLDQAIGALERECREAGQEHAWRIFAARDLDAPPEGRPSYEELARRHRVGVTDVTNLLFRTRKRLRELVLMRVRDTVTDDKEAEAEVRELFGNRLRE